MKNVVVTIALSLGAMMCCGQPFEGTMTYNITMVMTDLDAKRDIAEAKKEISNPANQEKYKQLQKNLEDPEFNAKLKADAKMRAELNPMMMTLSIASFEELLSGKVIVKMKGASSNARIYGTTMDGQGILYRGVKDTTYLVNHNAKEFTIREQRVDDQNVTVTKTDETDTILGYVCTKYTVLKNDPAGQPLLSYVWSTTDLKDVNLSKVLSSSIGAGSPLFIFKTIGGAPLRIQRKMTHGLLTTEISSIEKGAIASSEFEIPEGYIENK